MAEAAEIQQTVLGNVRDQQDMLVDAFAARDEFVAPFVKAFQAAPVSRVVFLGSGTSFNVSVLAASLFSRVVKVEGVAPYPTEFTHHGAGLDPAHTDPSSIVVVGVSQSGTSISTCEALRYAKQRGYRTLALTGDTKSRISTIADTVMPLLVGLELTGPETKGYTASIFSVYLWAFATARAVGAIGATEAEAAIAEAGGLAAQFDTVLKEAEEWYDRNRGGLLHSSRINVLGYGIGYGTMLEGVLKVAEMLRVPTIGNLLEEHVHGPTMALKFDHATLIIGSDEAEFERMVNIRDAISEHAPGVHVITCRDFDGADERDLVFSTKVSTYLAPLLYAVPFHFLAAKGGKDVYIDTNVNPVPIRFGHYQD
ncbi:SIS domain-containing protein [Streptomyces hygroscopicus]|uniref:SIS domain-containing protein n=1 Tax=Streptomyces hygroscopicus TaxID=1912 RepID=UPI000AE22DF8|nr:SIS domain-containing protein [Streptomyces hygroscopicus]